MEHNRLGAGSLCAQVQACLEEHILYLDQQSDKTQNLIRDHPTKGHPTKIPT
jgi:hypothetical protein